MILSGFCLGELAPVKTYYEMAPFGVEIHFLAKNQES